MASTVTTICPSPASERKSASPPMGSCRAMPRTLKSCVHCATSRLTSPLPCSCSVSVPSNFSVAASSTAAAIASPNNSCTTGGYCWCSRIATQLRPRRAA